MTGMDANTHARHAQISLRILALVSDGKTPRQAVDEVLGAGTFDMFAGKLYDALREQRSVVCECGGGKAGSCNLCGGKGFYKV